jgi:hypothetical protein
VVDDLEVRQQLDQLSGLQQVAGTGPGMELLIMRLGSTSSGHVRLVVGLPLLSFRFSLLFQSVRRSSLGGLAGFVL